MKKIFNRSLCLGFAAIAGAVAGSAAEIPWTESFDSQDAFNQFTVIDSNADSKVWEYYQSRSSARISYNGSKDMDDWLITPAFNLEKGSVYQFQLDAWNGGMCTERVAVMAGTAPTAEAMTIQVIEPTNITKSSATTLTGSFTAPETGTYYIGIHGCSRADQLYLYVDNLKLTQGVSASSPEGVESLRLIPDINGLDKVTVSCVLPTTNVEGANLSGIDRLEISCDNSVVATLENLTPGDEFTFTHEGAPLGRHSYAVVAYADGARGREVVAEVFVGPNIPGTVRNPKIGEFTPGQVTIMWDCPDKDVDGNPVNPDLVTYKVVTFDIMDNSLYVEEDIEGAENITATEYTHTAILPGQGQTFTAYGVYAQTSAGKSARLTTPLFPVGENYPAPYLESYDNGVASSLFRTEIIRNYEIVPSWDPVKDETLGISSRDAGAGFLMMSGENEDDCARYYSGKVSLDGLTRPALSLYLYNFSNGANNPDKNIFEVYVSDGTGFTFKKEQIIDQLPSQGWNRVTIDLSEYVGKTIQFAFQGTIRNYMFIPVDKIAIADLADCDLEAVELQLPENLTAGRPFQISAMVENCGALTASGYQVNLYRDGAVVATVNGPAVDPDDIAEVIFTDVLPVVGSSDVVYHIEVVADGDADLSNNTTSDVEVTPLMPRHPAPSVLAGEYVDGAVSLTWQAPDFSNVIPDAVTEDFEGFESFLTAGAGDWIFTDMDGEQVGKLDLTIPNVTFEGSVQSFWVMDSNADGANVLYEAHSGSKYLAQIFNNNNSACDDWIISPALYEGGQTISFYAKSYSSYASFAEQFEFLYSTGSTEPADFRLLASEVDVPNTWTRYEYTIPEGAARFAIRCTSVGCYMMFVDDITYIPSTGSVALELQGYNIYRDGTLINDTPVAEAAYADTEAPDGLLSYVVTALYDLGESLPSEELLMSVNSLEIADSADASVTINGGIGEILVSRNAAVGIEVYAPNGVLVASLPATATAAKVAAAPGIYLVKAGTTTVRVAVR